MSTNNSSNQSNLKVILAYLVVYIVWGSTFFFIEKALNSFPTFVLGSIRFLSAGPILLLYCYLKGYKIWDRKSAMEASLVGFLLLFIDMAAIIWSEQFISSAIVAIISAATAIWFILFDKPKWKQNFGTPAIVAGVLLGFCGVFMLFAEQIFMAPDIHDTISKEQKTIAMFVVTLGTIGWTIGSLASKYLQERKSEEQKTKDLNVIVKTAWQMITAGVAFTTVALVSGEYSSFDPNLVAKNDWFSITYLIFFGSILAFSCYIWLLQMRPATEVSTYAYVNPIVALLLAQLFTSHEVTQIQIGGLLVVLFSVLLMNWNIYKNNRFINAYRRKKKLKTIKLKRLKTMAPKSSIPRIIEIADFIDKEEDRKKR